MKKISKLTSVVLVALLLASLASLRADDLDTGFRNPPDSGKPWVYWWWLNGNVSKEGITADFEGMARIGMGGVLWMTAYGRESLPGTNGPVQFMDAQWWEMMRHTVREADRLGLKINLTNGEGWSHSGGPWVKPEDGMQALYLGEEFKLAGPVECKRNLQREGLVGVVAYQAPESKATGQSPSSVLGLESAVDLKDKIDADGNLRWEVPAGAWVVKVFRYKPNMRPTRPGDYPNSLECDKLNPAAIDAHWQGFVRRVLDECGPEARRVVRWAHVDSYEVGPITWSPAFRAEFRKRCGYDLLPYLPTVLGQTVGSQEITARFLWDFKRVCADLFAENIGGHLRALAKKDGLSLTTEPHQSVVFDQMQYAGHVSEPFGATLAERKTGWYVRNPRVGPESLLVKGESSAAYTYGLNGVVWAEMFPGVDYAHGWKETPAYLRTWGDLWFSEGVNRFCIISWVHSPSLTQKPGLTLGGYGTHFERGNTWTDYAAGYVTYLSRSQYLLQQGLPVVDVVVFNGDGLTSYFPGHPELRASGYDYHGLTAEILMQAKVVDGLIVLPSGMRYRLLVTYNREMRPATIRKLQELVEAGGVVLGVKPETAQGAPMGPVVFGGPEWRELFLHANREAQRLGLVINMNNDAGWCGSGGPWNTSEHSMQKLVWSETLVPGGQRVEAALPQPETVAGFYRDIAVLAFPAAEGEDQSMTAAAPRLTASSGEAADKLQVLVDGNPGTGITLPNQSPWVQVEFSQPYLARNFTFILGSSQYSSCSGEVQVSDNGREFRTVRTFKGNPPKFSIPLDSVQARWFRLVFTDFSPPAWAADKLVLSELSLRSVYRIENINGKAAFARFCAPILGAYPVLPEGVVTRRNQVVELTSLMDGRGKLRWDVPPGQWTVLRIGHTSTGKENAPAPKSGTGLECDKLSKEAVEAHFNGLLAKLIADAGELAGKSLVSTHIDSWEVDSQNWTPRMREEFQRLRGYDPLPFLPIVTGRVVDGLENSERFLWDLRLTVAELLADNYAGHLRELAGRHGLRLSVEAYGNGPFNCMDYAGRADEPMAEFWSWDLNKKGGGKDFHNPAPGMMSSAAHIYGKRIVPAEAFTASWVERWQGHPGYIKDLGDWAFCEGVNRFVFHAYTMQPWINAAPGMSWGPFGLHYNRGQTWWEQSRAWHEYLARCQYLLQQGLFAADIALLQPEGACEGFTRPAELDAAPHIRGGYNYDGCTPEVVMTRMAVKDGRIVLPDGMSYRVLVLPEVDAMTPALLGKIKELVAAGATVIGGSKPPQKSPSLADLGAGDAAVKKLAGELWAGGKIVTGKKPAQLLAERGVKPDFSSTPVLRYIHRVIGDTDAYFVANPQAEPIEALCLFRVSGKRPELWDPETGRMQPALAFEESGGETRLPLRLEQAGAIFVVFRPGGGKAAPAIVSVTRAGQELLPFSDGPRPVVSDLDIQRGEVTGAGTYRVKTADGKIREVVVPPLPAALDLSAGWQVHFDPKWGGPTGTVVFAELDDWSKRPQEEIKYYSGTALYRKVFNYSPVPGPGNSKVYLDLGEVSVMAQASLNGRDLGTLWKRPFRVEVSEALKPGENTLEIKAVNLWVNRLIGDEQLPEDSERLWPGTLKCWPQWLLEGKPSPTGRYSFCDYRLWKKNDTLVQSGLLGPVSLKTAQILTE